MLVLTLSSLDYELLTNAVSSINVLFICRRWGGRTKGRGNRSEGNEGKEGRTCLTCSSRRYGMAAPCCSATCISSPSAHQLACILSLRCNSSLSCDVIITLTARWPAPSGSWLLSGRLTALWAHGALGRILDPASFCQSDVVVARQLEMMTATRTTTTLLCPPSVPNRMTIRHYRPADERNTSCA